MYFLLLTLSTLVCKWICVCVCFMELKKQSNMSIGGPLKRKAFYGYVQVLPGMLQRRKGTILFTGARDSTRGEAGAAESGMFFVFS